MTVSHEEIVTVLRDEALGDPETGWLSDMGSFVLDELPEGIRVFGGGEGSIDLHHLASVVLSLISSAREEGHAEGWHEGHTQGFDAGFDRGAEH